MVGANSAQAGRRSSKPANLAHFFSKQLLLFVAPRSSSWWWTFLYVVLAYRESEANFNDISVTRTVDEALVRGEGAYTFTEAGVDELARHDAWRCSWTRRAVVWEQNRARRRAAVVHAERRHGGPLRRRVRLRGLLGPRRRAARHRVPGRRLLDDDAHLPHVDRAQCLPPAVLLIFAVDLGILFSIYAVSKPSDVKRGGSSRLRRAVEGAQPNCTSRRPARHRRSDHRDGAIIEQKDAARASWIRGISHDIRTPLSMILYAPTRCRTLQPRRRRERAGHPHGGLKIKDLVATDLTAQLDYDMPLHLERVLLPRLRTAAWKNSGLTSCTPWSSTSPRTTVDTVVLGRRAAAPRAVENAIANARLHNEQGCTICVTLRAEQRPEGRYGTVCVATSRASDDSHEARTTDLPSTRTAWTHRPRGARGAASRHVRVAGARRRERAWTEAVYEHGA